ncbi:unnamed protein product, partial [Mesorhabditis spiculigera]
MEFLDLPVEIQHKVMRMLAPQGFLNLSSSSRALMATGTECRSKQWSDVTRRCDGLWIFTDGPRCTHVKNKKLLNLMLAHSVIDKLEYCEFRGRPVPSNFRRDRFEVRNLKVNTGPIGCIDVVASAAKCFMPQSLDVKHAEYESFWPEALATCNENLRKFHATYVGDEVATLRHLKVPSMQIRLPLIELPELLKLIDDIVTEWVNGKREIVHIQFSFMCLGSYLVAQAAFARMKLDYARGPEQLHIETDDDTVTLFTSLCVL